MGDVVVVFVCFDVVFEVVEFCFEVVFVVDVYDVVVFCECFEVSVDGVFCEVGCFD